MSRLILPPTHRAKPKQAEPEKVVLRPVLNVVQIPSGEQRGKYSLNAHGKNLTDEICVIELRVFDTFDEARLVFDLLRAGTIKPEDVPEFEITDKMLLISRDYYAKQ